MKRPLRVVASMAAKGSSATTSSVCQITLVLVAAVAFIFAAVFFRSEYPPSTTATTLITQRRRLHKYHNRNHTGHNNDDYIDYHSYSCDSLHDLREKYANNNNSNSTNTTHPLFDQCDFAHQCNGGVGIVFPSLFCNNEKSSASNLQVRVQHVPLLIFLSLSLLVLFRLLCTTFDEFFAPGLELFTLKLGLPPRFAGTLGLQF